MKGIFSMLLFMPALCTAQTINYDWLNSPCAVLLNCDTGCTVCNLPVNESPNFTGTNMAFNNVQVCPHPIAGANNALSTYGWPWMPDASVSMAITGIAFQPTQIDSIVIRHRALSGGPERLEVKFGVNQSLNGSPVADVATSDSMTDLVLTDLGLVAPEAEMVYGFFQLELRAYDGGGGSWDLDAVRIVGSTAGGTWIVEHNRLARGSGIPVDVLGREVGTFITSGAYINGRRKVQVGR